MKTSLIPGNNAVFIANVSTGGIHSWLGFSWISYPLQERVPRIKRVLGVHKHIYSSMKRNALVNTVAVVRLHTTFECKPSVCSMTTRLLIELRQRIRLHNLAS